jgi:RTX calcium-binding nonapeptide repeat (4 copies)
VRVRRAAGVACVLGVLGGLPVGAAAQAPAGDSVTGSGEGSNSAGDAFGLTLDVSGGPSGESPTGELFFGATDASFDPDVFTWDQLVPTCLSVTGGTAIIGFRGTRTELIDQVPGAILGQWPEAGLVKVVDGGPAGPGTVQWAVNRGAEGSPDIPGPTTCDAFPGPFSQESLPAYNVRLELAVVDSEPTCAGRTATITGSGTVAGTAGDDVIVASDGDDVILGLGGSDVICAGAGVDHVYAGAGIDAVLDGAGDDFVRGGPGNDLLAGGAGNDQLRGRSGDDLVVGSLGDDTLLGADGRDTLLGFEDDDVLFGGPGPDRLDGGAGANKCFGGTGLNSLSNCG